MRRFKLCFTSSVNIIFFSLSIYLSIYIYLPTYLPTNLPVVCLFVSSYVGLSISFPVVHLLLPFSRYSCRFIASSLNSSASSPSQLPFPTFLQVVIVVVFLPVARSLFAYAICYPPWVLRVRIVSTCCCPVFPKLFVLPTFFVWWLHFLLLVVWRSLQLFSKNQFLYLTTFSLTCNPVSKFPTRNLICLLSLYKLFFSLYSSKYIYSSVGYLVL